MRALRCRCILGHDRPHRRVHGLLFQRQILQCWRGCVLGLYCGYFCVQLELKCVRVVYCGLLRDCGCECLHPVPCGPLSSIPWPERLPFSMYSRHLFHEWIVRLHQLHSGEIHKRHCGKCLHVVSWRIFSAITIFHVLHPVLQWLLLCFHWPELPIGFM